MILRNRAAGQREQKFAREIASVRLDSEREWNEFRDLARRLPGYTEDRSTPSATSSTTIQENDDVLEY